MTGVLPWTVVGSCSMRPDCGDREADRVGGMGRIASPRRPALHSAAAQTVAPLSVRAPSFSFIFVFYLFFHFSLFFAFSVSDDPDYTT